MGITSPKYKTSPPISEDVFVFEVRHQKEHSMFVFEIQKVFEQMICTNKD